MRCLKKQSLLVGRGLVTLSQGDVDIQADNSKNILSFTMDTATKDGIAHTGAAANQGGIAPDESPRGQGAVIRVSSSLLVWGCRCLHQFAAFVFVFVSIKGLVKELCPSNSHRHTHIPTHTHIHRVPVHCAVIQTQSIFR